MEKAVSTANFCFHSDGNVAPIVSTRHNLFTASCNLICKQFTKDTRGYCNGTFLLKTKLIFAQTQKYVFYTKTHIANRCTLKTVAMSQVTQNESILKPLFHQKKHTCSFKVLLNYANTKCTLIHLKL